MPRTSPGRTVAPRGRGRAAALAVLLAVLTALGLASPAAAHTELEGSDPAAGATATAPVARLVLTFTLPVTVLDDSVRVAGPDGAVPVELTQEQDGAAVVATPAAPLGDGDYTVDWTIIAEDGHPREGTLAFAVAAAGPTADSSAAATAAPTPTPAASPPGSSPQPSPASSPVATDPEAAGAPGGDTLARILARTGSAVALWALLVGGGALAFAAFVMREPDATDLPRLLAGVRWCGALLLGGLALRLVGRAALLQGGSLPDGLHPDALETALAGTVAWVIGLQAAGGLLMLVGAWRSVAASAAAIVGALVAGAGQVLGGHSNTAEPRALVLAADIVHLVAAAVWLGGVLTLVVVLRRRRRERRPIGAGRLASRFGVLGSASFVVVGIAGVALTWAIIDEPSDLWTSTWGGVLLIKVALVLVVAALGAYTHYGVLPRLNARSGAVDEDPPTAHLRRVAVVESLLFAVVVAVTAVLVASSIHA